MSTARIGFIGAGAFISAMHLVTARDSEIMEVRAIADLDEEKLRGHASAMKIGYTTTDYTKLLADPDIDIIVIGTKQDLHARFIVESLDAGKWVLCEKPMAQTREESAAVIAAEQRNSGRLAVGFNRRFAPAYWNAKRIMQAARRPWYINYRLMYPNPGKSVGFYADQERILFEGSHILDLVCWLLDSVPRRVFMTGDRLRDNCCILDFPDDSQVSFMCGSMGSFCLWKEYVEIFAYYTAITVSDFTDMRVRGFAGECDRIIPPHGGQRTAEVSRYGFDFYETYKARRMQSHTDEYRRDHGMVIEAVRRPGNPGFDGWEYDPSDEGWPALNPDKGWRPSLEHFAQCFLDGSVPDNADGRAGALSTSLALSLLESLESGQAVDFSR